MVRLSVKSLVVTALLTSAALQADVPRDPVPVVPGPGFPNVPSGVVDPRVATKVYFDCAVGPGYLVFRVADPSGYRFTENSFMGSREKCLAQVRELRKTRGTVTEATNVAMCVTAGGPTFLRRRIIYPVGYNWAGYITAGGVQKLPDQEYPVKECLEYAADLNGTGVVMPPGVAPQP